MLAFAVLVGIGAAAASSERRPSLLGAHTLEEAAAFASVLYEASPIDVGSYTVHAQLLELAPLSSSARRVKVSASRPSGTALLYCEGAPLTDLLDFLVLGPEATNELTLTHARCPLVFRLASPEGAVGVASAALPPVALGTYHTRVAYGPVPQTQMWVSWTSDNNATSAPAVLVGTAPGDYTLRMAAPAGLPFYDTYYAADMCGAGANRTSVLKYLFPGWFANVLLTGLQPETLYYYSHGSDSHGFSPEVCCRSILARGRLRRTARLGFSREGVLRIP
jgi:hypothetical protein